jgi:hypothetical protein
MDVEINEVRSTVRAVDGDSLLSPATLQRIVSIVLKAIEEHDGREKRVKAEQRITRGVSQELEERL